MMKLKLFLTYISFVLMFLFCPGIAHAVEITDPTGDEIMETVEDPEEEVVLEYNSESLVSDPGIQVMESIDYTEYISRIEQTSALNNELLQYIAGFNLFFVIILICYFGYRFFRMFF